MADQPDWISGSQSVITDVTAYNANVAFTAGGTFVVPADLSQFASINVQLNGIQTPTALSYLWYDSTGTIQLGGGVIYSQQVNGALFFTLRVKGGQLRLVSSTSQVASPPQVVVIGSNLVADSDLFGFPVPEVATQTAAWTITAPVPFVNFISTGKSVFVAAVLTLAGAKGQFSYFYTDTTGATNGVVFLDMAQAPADSQGFPRTFATVLFPPGLIQIDWQAWTAANFTAQIALVTTQ